MFVVIGVSLGLVPVHTVDRQSAESHASCFGQRESSDDMLITTYNILGGPRKILHHSFVCLNFTKQ